ncbi:MAG: tripartite tricarboxylate transporter substrate binding protein, partial [Comamonas sp.]|nr:tripartite tricarboxylate transporter substrate binding protein [Comamonas sp.]
MSFIPTRRRWTLQLATSAAALALGLPLTAVQAQSDWPSKPIRMVVGFPPGSMTDTVARILSDHLGKVLGQPVVVENKSGANGSLGVGEVARSAPDGYTLLVTNSSSITINPQLYKKSPYQAKDFTPITMLMDAPFILIANPAWAQKNSIHSPQDMIGYAQRNPDRISYGSAGPGNIAHLSFTSWGRRTHTSMTHVPYKGGAQAQMAVLSGELDAMFETWAALPQIQASKLKALAVTAPQRMKQLPQVPTMAEAGYDNFNVTFWMGLLGPANLPQPIVQKLYEASKSLAQDARATAALATQGEMVLRDPADFSQRIRKEVQEWGGAIQR